MNRPASIDASTLLKKHGFRPRHRLGQNFLQDTAILEQIATEAGIGSDDTVLEVGCGFGSLTKYLAPMARSVVAVELDERLLRIARSYLSSYSNVRFLCADILKRTVRELNLPPAYIVAANIPYYLTSPILRHLLESDPKPTRLVLTIQKEVARRICAKPPDMSLLTLSVQLYGATSMVAEIPPESFFPPPKVDSAIVRIDCYAVPPIPPSQIPVAFRLARAGFSHRRKTLRNTLASGLKIQPSQAIELLQNANIDPQRRAETLSLEEWARLSEKEILRVP